MYQSFTEMPIWRLGIDILKEAYKLSDLLPPHEKFSMISQIRNAALSISGNIAEAFGRGHIKDKLNFYYYSRGSAHETMSHFYAAVAVGYLREEEIQPLLMQCNEVILSLNKLISKLSVSIQKPASKEKQQ